MLCLVHLLLFIGEPADRRRVKQKLRAAESSQPRRFGEPLVPANERADPAVSCVVRLKAEISGREIKLLVVERIVRDMHLAILARDLAGSVDHHGSIVIDAGSALFEE